MTDPYGVGYRPQAEPRSNGKEERCAPGLVNVAQSYPSSDRMKR